MKEVPPPNISCTLTFPLHEFSCAGVGMFLWGYIVCMISFFFFIWFPSARIFSIWTFPANPSSTQLPHQIRPEMLSLLSTSSRSWQSWAMMARQPNHKGSLCLSLFFVHAHARKTRRGSDRERAAQSRRRNLTQVSNVCQAAAISTNWQKCV